MWNVPTLSVYSFSHFTDLSTLIVQNTFLKFEKLLFWRSWSSSTWIIFKTLRPRLNSILRQLKTTKQTPYNTLPISSNLSWRQTLQNKEFDDDTITNTYNKSTLNSRLKKLDIGSCGMSNNIKTKISLITTPFWVKHRTLHIALVERLMLLFWKTSVFFGLQVVRFGNFVI